MGTAPGSVKRSELNSVAATMTRSPRMSVPSWNLFNIGVFAMKAPIADCCLGWGFLPLGFLLDAVTAKLCLLLLLAKSFRNKLCLCTNIVRSGCLVYSAVHLVDLGHVLVNSLALQRIWTWAREWSQWLKVTAIIQGFGFGEQGNRCKSCRSSQA